MNAGITAINEEVERASAFVQPLLGVEEYVLAGAPPGTTESDLFEGVEG